jgi:hypothetical protein
LAGACLQLALRRAKSKSAQDAGREAAKSRCLSKPHDRWRVGTIPRKHAAGANSSRPAHSLGETHLWSADRHRLRLCGPARLLPSGGLYVGLNLSRCRLTFRLGLLLSLLRDQTCTRLGGGLYIRLHLSRRCCCPAICFGLLLHTNGGSNRRILSISAINFSLRWAGVGEHIRHMLLHRPRISSRTAAASALPK